MAQIATPWHERPSREGTPSLRAKALMLLKSLGIDRDMLLGAADLVPEILSLARLEEINQATRENATGNRASYALSAICHETRLDWQAIMTRGRALRKKRA